MDNPFFDQVSDEATVENAQENILVDELPPQLKRKLELVQAVVDAPDNSTKRQCIKYAAEELGVSTKTIKRSANDLKTYGVAALIRSARSDKGGMRHISEPWVDLTLQIYKRVQKESRQNSRNQVWILIRGLIDRLESTKWTDPDELKKLIDWWAQKLGSSEENKKSKINIILSAIKKEMEAGIIRPPRSHVSVYRIIDDYLEQKKCKRIFGKYQLIPM